METPCQDATDIVVMPGVTQAAHRPMAVHSFVRLDPRKIGGDGAAQAANGRTLRCPFGLLLRRIDHNLVRSGLLNGG